jgi:TonB family protein
MSAMELAVLSYGLNSLWQVALVALAAMAIAELAGRVAAEPARARHRVWVAALVAEVVLPACPVRPERVVRGLLALFGARRPALGHVGVRIGLSTSALAPHGMPRVLVASLAAAYLGSILYFLGRLLHGLLAWRALLRGAEELCLTPVQTQAWSLACGGGVRVASSPRLSGPVTLGVWRPVLLLPPRMLERISAEDQAALFAHEAAHLRRHDFGWNLLYAVLALPIAYHPLLWWTRARVAESREMICDSLAASALRGAEPYRRSLLRLAGLLAQGATASPLHAIGLLDAHTFERRLMNLTLKPMVVSRTRRIALSCACLLVASATCTSALALRIDPPVGDGPTHVSGAEQAGHIVYKAPPIYPPEAKANHDTLNGAVILHVRIGTDGSLKALQLKKSLRQDYDMSAWEAVKRWRWEPFLVNGVPTEVESDIQINYEYYPEKNEQAGNPGSKK